MRITKLAFVLSLLFQFPLSGLAQIDANNGAPQTLAHFSESLRDLSAGVSSSVVQITVTGYGVDNGEQHTGILSRQRSTGSGVIVDADGYIITNAHVIQGAHSIRVKLNGNRPAKDSLFDAKLIGKDTQLDLALLKIPVTGLKPLQLGNSQDLRQGEIVLAFGSPLGMENSVSMGIVSATARQLTDDDPRIFIQTDAPINPGNSGGPLVDVRGRVVGINTFNFTKSGGSEGIGFAIPSNVVRYVYASLKRDGRVRRAQIGVMARTITPTLAAAFDLQPATGVLVEDVIPGSPADKAGIYAGDVILSIGAALLQNVRDLAATMYEYKVGDIVPIEVQRRQKTFPLQVPVAEKQNDLVGLADLVNPDRDVVPQLGILGLNVDDNIRQILPLRYNEGVLVAAFAGLPSYFGEALREGDVIHAINGRRVTTVETLRHELDDVKRGQPIALQTERNGSLTFLVLEAN
jgi:serine protease Do